MKNALWQEQNLVCPLLVPPVLAYFLKYLGNICV